MVFPRYISNRVDPPHCRFLIFVVPYNAETTIEIVLSRVPSDLHAKDVEVLIIDAAHSDKLGFPSSQTFAVNACLNAKNVLQLGIDHANIAAGLRRKHCDLTEVDFPANEITPTYKTPSFIPAPVPRLPANLPEYDRIVLRRVA